LLVPVCPRSGRLAPYVHCYNYTYTWETGLPGHPRCFWETGHYSLASVGSGCLVVVGYCDVICGCDLTCTDKVCRWRTLVVSSTARRCRTTTSLTARCRWLVPSGTTAIIEAYNEKQVSQSCCLSSPVPPSVVAGPALCRRRSRRLSSSVLLSVVVGPALCLHSGISSTA